MCVFVRLLLRRLQTDGRQTWQEGRGRARKKHGGVCFHGNHHVAMATKKGAFYGQIRTMVWYKIVCDVNIHDVTSPMTSCVTSPWQWRHGNHLLHLGASALLWAAKGWKSVLHFCQFVQVRVSWEPHWQCASYNKERNIKVLSDALISSIDDLQITSELHICIHVHQTMVLLISFKSNQFLDAESRSFLTNLNTVLSICQNHGLSFKRKHGQDEALNFKEAK